MNRKVLGLLVAFLFITSIAFASVAMQENGVNDGVATTLNILSIGTSNDGSTYSIGPDVEVATEGDTLVTADSGNIIVYFPGSVNAAATFNLPSAADGMRFTFIQDEIGRITVNPLNNDKIRYLTLDSGDSIVGPAATGDSVTLISHTTGYWSVENMFGSWTDGS